MASIREGLRLEQEAQAVALNLPLRQVTHCLSLSLVPQGKNETPEPDAL